MAEEVELGELGHFGPVYSAHVFAPADDLSDKSFHLSNAHLLLVGPPMGLHGLDHFQWRKHLAVEGKAQARVK
jgi:hypothetical protein